MKAETPEEANLRRENEELRKALLAASREAAIASTRYFDLFARMPAGGVMLSLEGTIQAANPAAARLLGGSPLSLAGRRFADFIAAESQDEWQAQWQAMQTPQVETNFPILLAAPAGSGRPVRIAGRNLGAPGMPAVVRLVLMTEKGEAFSGIRTDGFGEDFFRLIVENVQDYFVVVDLDGRRIYNSPSYARLFGDAERLKGTDSFADIHPEDRERVRIAFQETVRTGRGHRLYYRFLLADGSIRYMESCGALIRDSFGNPLRVVVVARDITERIENEQEIRTLAFYDSLTLLPNRRLLHDRLEQAIAAAKRHRHHVALMLLDLDNFKPLNDQWGHKVGDLLLIEVARRLTDCIREMDTVARYGGDEFVVLLPTLSPEPEVAKEQAHVVAEKIRAALAEPFGLSFIDDHGRRLAIAHRCTASIGVRLLLGDEAPIDDLLAQADAAMYRAKVSGRNRVEFYEPSKNGALAAVSPPAR